MQQCLFKAWFRGGCVCLFIQLPLIQLPLPKLLLLQYRIVPQLLTSSSEPSNRAFCKKRGSLGFGVVFGGRAEITVVFPKGIWFQATHSVPRRAGLATRLSRTQRTNRWVTSRSAKNSSCLVSSSAQTDVRTALLTAPE